jgi:hypothetical protein
MAHHSNPIVLPVEDTPQHPNGATLAQPTTHPCHTAGHHWQATIILGYFQCSCCNKLAACLACVPKVRGRAMPGYCQAHRHLRAPETPQEVLG